MIQLISKEQFNRNISDSVQFTKIFKKLRIDDRFYFAGSKIFTHFLVNDKYYIIFIDRISYLLIPDIYDKNEVMACIEEDDIIQATEWRLVKISDRTTYPINVFEKIYSRIYIFCEIIKPGESGTWNLINDRTGEVLTFQLKDSIDCYSSKESGKKGRIIAYKEKEEIPIDRQYILEKDIFLEQIINGCKKDI